VKRAIGKEIPTTDSTYLQGLSRKVTEKFPQVYDYIRLSGYANKNQLRIEELEQKIQQLEIAREKDKLDILALQTIVQFALPKERIIKAILEMHQKGIIDLSTIELVDKTSMETLEDSLMKLSIEDLRKLLLAESRKD